MSVATFINLVYWLAPPCAVCDRVQGAPCHDQSRTGSHAFVRGTPSDRAVVT